MLHKAKFLNIYRGDIIIHYSYILLTDVNEREHLWFIIGQCLKYQLVMKYDNSYFVIKIYGNDEVVPQCIKLEQFIIKNILQKRLWCFVGVLRFEKVGQNDTLCINNH